MRVSVAACLAVAASTWASPVTLDSKNADNVLGHTFSIAQVHNSKFDNTETGLDARLFAYIKYNAALPEKLQEAVRMGEHVNARYKTLAGRGKPRSPVRRKGKADRGSRVQQQDGRHGRPGAGVSAAAERHSVRRAGADRAAAADGVSQPRHGVGRLVSFSWSSSDFSSDHPRWTFSSETPESQVQDQVLYSPEASNTSRLQEGQTWSIRYGDGSGAAGVVYTDRVAIGVTSFDRQAVETARGVSGMFTRDSFSSGILGLGFGRGNRIRPARARTYLENILPTLAAPLFTANLLAGRPGNYNFGYVSPREHQGPIAYAPVTRENTYWEISVDGVQVGARGAFRPARDLLERVVVDTGTTLILLPDELVGEYYDEVRGARYEDSWGGFVFPCASAMPDWFFGLGDYRGRVPGEYIRFDPVNDTHCFGGIQSAEGIGFSLFGATLLKAQFAVFDYVDVEGRATPRVGFANKRLLRFD